ncbi:lipase family protein [Paraburkholderia metrosideri]|uniref:Fungal lipase-like domain-containing protein n=1 Tax=Paraburkholderia metrosideri TaxID=580937 RepID=A0ABM8NJF7_9BURK|nr:hypothetical protein [Paraburkholderia metrosideri]CAD6528454.1 hypothetical protein LMG28140_02126 [Paraburkholderia metrosideri]
MRFDCKRTVLSACATLLCATAASHAQAGTWESAFGVQDLDVVVNAVLQESDAGRRASLERPIAAAFKQDDTRADYVTGVLQITGGVPELERNPAHGLELIQTAARRGLVAARVKLAALVEAGNTNIDARQVRVWLDEFAGSNGTAAYADATLWSQGLGGQRNACRANQLLQVAQRQNVNPDGQLQQRLAQTLDACNGGLSASNSASQRPAGGISSDEWSKIMQLRGTSTSNGPSSPAQSATLPAGQSVTSAATMGAPSLSPVAPSVAPAPPAALAAPSASTASQPGVAVGVPADAATRDFDKMLALLSYAVYADPAKLADAQQKADDLQNRVARVQADQTLDPLIKPHEVRKLDAAFQAASMKVAEVRNQLAVKTQVAQTYGLQRVHLPAAESEAEAGHVYAEIWATQDGRRIVVFRGTDNNTDWVTDAQIGLTPELAGELTARVKSLSGQSLLTGTSALAVKGYDAGHFDADDMGRPRAFSVADNLVRAVMRSGVAPSQVTLTGHSLGGGYAQYAGFKNGVAQIVTFNPAPLNSRQQADVQAGIQHFGGQVRHYVSYIALSGNAAGRVYDPVSQLTSEYLHQPDLASLRVIGTEYAVPVCADLRSPEYQAFSGNVQDRITHKTFGSMDKGGENTKRVGKVIGQADGYVSASTDKSTAMDAGGDVGQVPGHALGTASYCMKHPYLCSAKFAVGGMVSALATDFTPRAWTILSAHRMKNLEEAIQQNGKQVCEAPSAQLAGR